MAAAAASYGRHGSSNKQQQQQPGKDAGDVEQGSAAAAAGPFCGCVGAFGRSWAEAKEELATFMLVSWIELD
jgi:hypothetical protein